MLSECVKQTKITNKLMQVVRNLLFTFEVIYCESLKMQHYVITFLFSENEHFLMLQ